MTDKINHENTDTIVCPWCGKIEPPFTLGTYSRDIVLCKKCGNHYEVVRPYTYTTTKAE